MQVLLQAYHWIWMHGSTNEWSKLVPENDQCHDNKSSTEWAKCRWIVGHPRSAESSPHTHHLKQPFPTQFLQPRQTWIFIRDEKKSSHISGQKAVHKNVHVSTWTGSKTWGWIFLPGWLSSKMGLDHKFKTLWSFLIVVASKADGLCSCMKYIQNLYIRGNSFWCYPLPWGIKR